MRKIRIAVNGYGVIGKRVADAIGRQDDMELVGVCDVASDYRLRMPWALGLPIFAATENALKAMEAAGITPKGQLSDLLKEAEVVVDCTPKRVAAANLPLYRESRVKFILQGGEKHETTEHSFVAQANYESALDRDCTRVVSCNTTATVRMLGALAEAGLLLRARGTLLRRATDPWESHESGIMNTIVPEADIPSHQGPDAQTVLPDLDVITVACKVPETLGHVHYWWAELAKDVKRDEVIALLRGTARVVLATPEFALDTPNSIKEFALDIGRPRADLWEVCVWEHLVQTRDRELFWAHFVDNQAIVVPENIDAIRALTGIERSGKASIEQTDRSLSQGWSDPKRPFSKKLNEGECCDDRSHKYP